MLLRHINYFLAVAEHCSFTRAAAALHVSQPALSQQIRQLEERLGAQLFDRTGRAICLTDAGKVYFRHARQALLDLERGERAIHDVGDLSRGTLRIAVTPTFTTYLVGPLVELFHNLYPNIVLTIREASQEYMEELLLADIIDVGIAFADTSSPDIAKQELLVETLALVVGRHHRLAKCEMISLKDLQDEALVLLTSEFATRKQIDHACHENNIHPHVVIEANSLSAVIEIVRRTNLSTLLPAKTASGQEGLIAVAMDPVLLDRTAVLLQRKNAYQAVAARAFIELALKFADIDTEDSIKLQSALNIQKINTTDLNI